jgi:hypothetical protein
MKRRQTSIEEAGEGGAAVSPWQRWRGGEGVKDIRERVGKTKTKKKKKKRKSSRETK